MSSSCSICSRLKVGLLILKQPTMTALAITATLVTGIAPTTEAAFQAGAAKTDITPNWFPVLVNGSMTSRSVDTVTSPISARSVALSDHSTTIVMVVVDSCMIPRDLIDRAKARASQSTGISTDRILVSATHTHTAPSCVGALGTDPDTQYVAFLENRLVEAIEAPLKNLEPARIGFGRIEAGAFNAVRRWVVRPDRIKADPFGNRTVRATMHAARNWDDAIGPTGPKDPELSLISIQSTDGRPISVIANYSMHYFRSENISADYFGLFSEGIKDRLQSTRADEAPEFVAMMSHGCSGDIWRRDYSLPPEERNEDITIDEYTHALLEKAIEAYGSIEYTIPESIYMVEKRFSLNHRKPDAQRLKWAQQIVEALGDRLPQTQPEIYAREQLFLHRSPPAEIVMQAIRIGDKIAIATFPTETYALTGLKVKAASPVENTMVIELANGAEGYIPPPEQHLLGGYNTWEARSAGLEVTAEPRMAETAIQLLEQVSESNRRPKIEPSGPAVRNLLSLEPTAYWRLDEFSGPRAIDASGNHFDAIYEPQVLFYLKGPASGEFVNADTPNRAAHFAGHRLLSRIPDLGTDYSFSLWFWNGMPAEGRNVTGWIFSRGRDGAMDGKGDHVGIGGMSGHPGKIILLDGQNGGVKAAGPTLIKRWTWNHLAFARAGREVSFYLNGKREIRTDTPSDLPRDLAQIFFGGRSDNQSNFEGRLDEIAVFDRALSESEIRMLAAPSRKGGIK